MRATILIILMAVTCLGQSGLRSPAFVAQLSKSAVASVTEVGTPSVTAHASTTALTWSHTVPAGATVLIVRVGSYQNAPTGVTWDGNAMTSAGAAVTSGGNDVAAIFYLVSPTPATGNVIVSFGGGTGCSAWASQYSGASGVGGYTTGSTTSISVSSVVGALVVDIIAQYAGSPPTPGAGQTQDFVQTNFPTFEDAHGSHESGATSVTMDWSGTAGTYALAGLSINP